MYVSNQRLLSMAPVAMFQSRFFGPKQETPQFNRKKIYPRSPNKDMERKTKRLSWNHNRT